MAELTREEFDRITQEATRTEGVRHRDTLIAINNLATEVRDFAGSVMKLITQLQTVRKTDGKENSASQDKPWGMIAITVAIVAATNAPVWTSISNQNDMMQRHLITSDRKFSEDDHAEKGYAAALSRLAVTDMRREKDIDGLLLRMRVMEGHGAREQK